LSKVNEINASEIIICEHFESSQNDGPTLKEIACVLKSSGMKGLTLEGIYAKTTQVLKIIS